MKKYLLAGMMVFFMAAFVCVHADETVFKQLHALEGMWIMKTANGTIGEEWVKVNDGYLQNKGFYVKRADTIVTETVALKNNNEGIFYTSTVADQNEQRPVAFKMVSSDKRVFIFENYSHDFPKRIVYNLVSADSIHAYIDGGREALTKRQDFYFRKVK